MNLFFKPRRLVWFSCGAASAVAAKLTTDSNPKESVEYLYCDTLAFEHPDNLRFIKDVEQWIGANAPAIYGGISALYYGGYHFEEEWYRHDRRSNTLWLSGQVQKIPFTGYAAGIDYRYYTGEKPLSTLPGN